MITALEKKFIKPVTESDNAAKIADVEELVAAVEITVADLEDRVEVLETAP